VRTHKIEAVNRERERKRERERETNIMNK